MNRLLPLIAQVINWYIFLKPFYKKIEHWLHHNVVISKLFFDKYTLAADDSNPFSTHLCNYQQEMLFV